MGEHSRELKKSGKKSLGLHELRQQKSGLMKDFYLFKIKKEVQVQWLQHPKQSNIHNSNNVRGKPVDISGTKEEHLNAKID